MNLLFPSGFWEECSQVRPYPTTTFCPEELILSDIDQLCDHPEYQILHFSHWVGIYHIFFFRLQGYRKARCACSTLVTPYPALRAVRFLPEQASRIVQGTP